MKTGLCRILLLSYADKGNPKPGFSTRFQWKPLVAAHPQNWRQLLHFDDVQNAALHLGSYKDQTISQARPVRPEGQGLFEMIERDSAWRWRVPHQYLSLKKTWEECEYNICLWAPRPLPAWGDKLQLLWCYCLQPLAQKVVPVQHFTVKLMLAYFGVTKVLMSFLSRLHSKQIFFLETAVLREINGCQ